MSQPAPATLEIVQHITPISYILLLTCLLMGGCALPRAIALHAEITKEVPIPDGGSRKCESVNPKFGESSANTEIEVNMAKDAAIDWYRHRLESEKWVYFPDRAKVPDPKDKDAVELYFQREVRAGWRGSPWDSSLFDVLTLDFRSRGPAKADVQVHLSADILTLLDSLTLCIYLPWYLESGSEPPAWLFAPF